MSKLNYDLYRTSAVLAECVDITPENVDQLLDEGKIKIRVGADRWWAIRRNGRTAKRNGKVRIPFKYGLTGYGAIEERDFI